MNIDTLTELFKKFAETNLFKVPAQTSELVPVIKQFEDEQMESIEVLYCAPLEADAHNEGMTEDEIRKMVDNFNTNITKIKGNFGHAVNTDKFSPLKAWVNECECLIGDQVVPEGMPLVKLKYHDPELWQQRKDGLFKGISIGARGIKVDSETE